MKLYVLDHGTEILDKSFFIAGANSGTASNKNPENEWITIPIQTFLIEQDGEYLLFDTGCDPQWKTNWPAFIPEQSPYFATEEQQLLNRLRQIGVSSNEIKYVVMSHLHVDHAGNLEHFKNATVYVNENEFKETLLRYCLHRDLDVHVPSDIRHYLEANLCWELVPDEVKELEVFPNVTILNFGSGHSFGMMGIRVDLPNTGSLLLVADAIYSEENIRPEIKVPGILYDSLGYRRTAQYILDYAEKNSCRIIFGHDIGQFTSMVKSQDGYYD